MRSNSVGISTQFHFLEMIDGSDGVCVCVVWRSCHDDSDVNSPAVLPQRSWCDWVSTHTHTHTVFYWWKQMGVVSSRLMSPLGFTVPSHTHTHTLSLHWQITIMILFLHSAQLRFLEAWFQEPPMYKEQETQKALKYLQVCSNVWPLTLLILIA